jgi:hypothetical protein
MMFKRHTRVETLAKLLLSTNNRKKNGGQQQKASCLKTGSRYSSALFQLAVPCQVCEKKTSFDSNGVSFSDSDTMRSMPLQNYLQPIAMSRAPASGKNRVTAMLLIE